ncbi:MAG: TIGR02757 family protein [Bergeyella sp.]|nr:TIGR02757 family protein [Bergeyella sp.]
MDFAELQSFLEEKVSLYNHVSFIEHDPVQIPHRFSLLQDIEIVGFLTATVSWGNRRSIIKSAQKMTEIMGENPYDFILNFSSKYVESLHGKAIHRTFSGEDFCFFLHALKRIYSEYESMENLFLLKENETNFCHAIERFREFFFGENISHRSIKHISSPYKNSAAKRLMMFLRWMIRKDHRGVDFGIWNQIDQKFLSVPLDIHTGNISRKLKLITRKQNDWKTVEELDEILRKMDEKDPAKYDFALFGIGINEKSLFLKPKFIF